MRILCLSNGHGEDAIAVQVLEQIQAQSPEVSLAALPIVGTGHAYQKLDIPIISRTQQMPSGGFVYMDNQQLMRDIQGGLIKLTLQQNKAIRHWAKQTSEKSLILAVGDIVPLIFSLLSGANYAFIGTAKSEYYLRDSDGTWLRQTSALEKWFGSVYLPWERWLLSRKRCLAVYPRDRLTTEILCKYKIPAFDLGNPMMDGLEEPELEEYDDHRPLTLVLLPGSRQPEAVNNWQTMLRAIPGLVEQYPKLILIAAIAPSLDLTEFIAPLTAQNWQAADTLPNSLTFTDPEAQTFTQGQSQFVFTQHSYADSLHCADMAIAMAGTATEQFVGLGKPALSIIGEGPQFTPAFAEAQTRLLGHSVIMHKDPTDIAHRIKSLLKKPDYLQSITNNGFQRMGEPGAAKRIAQHLQQIL
ncbi:MAG: hypothetical protein HC799_14980 [Limnothrix sp. RL_2_0]|nr:hypothetical protein [Limnothrix sp. RL_2_0]